MPDDPPVPAPTLFARATAAARGALGDARRAARTGWAALRERAAVSSGGGPRPLAVALALCALIALGPAIVLVASAWQVGPAEAEARGLEATAARRDADARSVEQARATLRALIRRPTLGAMTERLASALPEDGRIASLTIDREGVVTVEATAPDPDQLRAALRRDSALARLRDAGQRRGDAMMIVTFRGQP